MNRICNEDNLVTLDVVLTFVPLVSTVVCAVNIIAKAVFLPVSHETIRNHSYLKHLKLKNYPACILGLIPIIGNVALAIIIIHGAISSDGLSAAGLDPGPDSTGMYQWEYEEERQRQQSQQRSEEATQKYQQKCEQERRIDHVKPDDAHYRFS